MAKPFGECMGNESPRQDKRRLLNSLAQPKPVRPPKPLGAPHVIERVSNGIRILGTDPAKAKHPAVNPWVPEEFAGPIGKVVLTLNWLEQDLVALLRSIEAHNGTNLSKCLWRSESAWPDSRSPWAAPLSATRRRWQRTFYR
ncbi:MAG: hypothetical protein M3O01_04365 [Pseudomonadota bacterium]|nr:hypothetical protein [Pseudomonadota bacterium]